MGKMNCSIHVHISLYFHFLLCIILKQFWYLLDTSNIKRKCSWCLLIDTRANVKTEILISDFLDVFFWSPLLTEDLDNNISVSRRLYLTWIDVMEGLFFSMKGKLKAPKPLFSLESPFLCYRPLSCLLFFFFFLNAPRLKTRSLISGIFLLLCR